MFLFSCFRFGMRNVKKVWIFVIFFGLCLTFYFLLENSKNFHTVAQKIISFRSEKYVEFAYKTLKERELGLEVPSFPIDPDCLRTAGENNFMVKDENEDFEFLKTEEGKNFKKILFYYHKYPMNNRFGSGHKVFERYCCREKRCFLTDKKDRIPFKEFDSILIQHSHFDFKTIPKERTKEQRWIMVDLEPPSYYSEGLAKYRNIFNWTMTHRRDSDIPIRYGYVYTKKDLPLKSFYDMENIIQDVETLVKKKTKSVVWLVSHCETYSGREFFVEELKKYIDVDIYGKCGTLDCGDIKHFPECYEKFQLNYKFYLSFENSICADYITEKFFNILRYYIVPVVFGAGDYSAVAPPHSYINARHFGDAESLAQYLHYLDSNDTAYIEYFKWKKDYISSGAGLANLIGVCNLCEKLHNIKEEKVYPDMEYWYLRESHCLFCGQVPIESRNVTKCYNNVKNYKNRLSRNIKRQSSSVF